MQNSIMVFNSLDVLTPGYLSDQSTNRNDVTHCILSERVCEQNCCVNEIAVPFSCTNFLKTVLLIVVRYFRTASTPWTNGKQNLLRIFFINLILVPFFHNFSKTAFM